VTGKQRREGNAPLLPSRDRVRARRCCAGQRLLPAIILTVTVYGDLGGNGGSRDDLAP
jgi:hypothetical protein